MQTVNCPILVGHLNRLSSGSDEQKAFAFQLVMMLDDIEGIAGLMDHTYPADRHALARLDHIIESAKRARNLIPEIVAQSDALTRFALQEIAAGGVGNLVSDDTVAADCAAEGEEETDRCRVCGVDIPAGDGQCDKHS